jgi:hypothetical protein
MAVDFMFSGLVVAMLLAVFPDGFFNFVFVCGFVWGTGLGLPGDVCAFVVLGNRFT